MQIASFPLESALALFMNHPDSGAWWSASRKLSMPAVVYEQELVRIYRLRGDDLEKDLKPWPRAEVTKLTSFHSSSDAQVMWTAL